MHELLDKCFFALPLTSTHTSAWSLSLCLSRIYTHTSHLCLPLYLQTIGTKPIAHIDQFTPEMMGTAELAEEVNLDGSGKLVKVMLLSGPPSGLA